MEPGPNQNLPLAIVLPLPGVCLMAMASASPGSVLSSSSYDNSHLPQGTQ
jgi:hypothetical protein